MTSLKKLAALFGAGALVFAMAGTVLAATPASDQGVVPTTVDPGNITLDGKGNNDSANCAVADGLETGDSAGSDDTDNGVHVAWTYDGTSKAFGFTATGGLVTIAYVKGGNGYNKYDYTGKSGGGVASDGNMFAPDTNGDGKPQGLSHAVFCTSPSESEPTPTPTFGSSQAGETDQATEPNTAAIGGNGTSGPADSAWLLVVALGVLLASVVVLTPARAKSRR
ncbi:MAG: hypothetical protein HYX55_09195 [Chloroflexi bacterium]|nr:hypothetical protein [Chloroflexota bacterium]